MIKSFTKNNLKIRILGLNDDLEYAENKMQGSFIVCVNIVACIMHYILLTKNCICFSPWHLNVVDSFHGNCK